MRKISFFRRYLLLHFLSLILLPLMIIIMVFGMYPTSGQINMDTANMISSASILVSLIITIFIFISWVFFYRLRKQLISLQKAMSIPEDGSWIPESVPERTFGMNEVDQLAASFNQMLQQLRDSRSREQEEETLRKQLIASLSHDLRTPLTALRSHASRLQREPLSQEGAESLAAVDRTITHIGELMEELLSYTLLTSGKYPYRPEPTDMVRLIRTSIASWYSTFEEANFHIDIDLTEEKTFSWEIDSGWMARILDNLFQNILRHAYDGRYISITVDVVQEQIIIRDFGPGMDNSSANSGAGIGLEIVKHMLNQMNLQARFYFDTGGTTVTIKKN